MDFELITTLVGSGESETLEFKATTGSRREAAHPPDRHSGVPRSS